jgi:rhodanese-related sulfurtransferase
MKLKLSSISLLLLIFLFSCNAQAQYKTIQASEFTAVVKAEKAIVIDVRTEGEVAAGYIKGVTVFANVNGPDFTRTIKTLDPSKSYVVYCRSGARSARASEIMSANGFKKVFNLSGGILGFTGEITKP